ncbi:hypothetical protein FGO68_gene11691 [Halteria grandinella]|uniref:Uncharacterized protein n=1 Tax=Halteria grandinella TaxID=5974 RepID=A0A8J8NS43_HALGN|nr:hypothetical protein FGO68_gene11691 [Halteria grandinella]
MEKIQQNSSAPPLSQSNSGEGQVGAQQKGENESPQKTKSNALSPTRKRGVNGAYSSSSNALSGAVDYAAMTAGNGFMKRMRAAKQTKYVSITQVAPVSNSVKKRVSTNANPTQRTASTPRTTNTKFGSTGQQFYTADTNSSSTATQRKLYGQGVTATQNTSPNVGGEQQSVVTTPYSPMVPTGGLNYSASFHDQIPGGNMINPNITTSSFMQGSQQNTGYMLEQAKKQKGQIEKDVFSLRNRVRLLEIEHKRAVKKISEANQRATHMADLKSKNDQKFMERLMSQESMRDTLKEQQIMNLELQKRQRQSIQEARFSMYLVKNQQVKSVKQEIMTEKERYANDLAIQYEQITERKQEIHTQRETAKNAVQNFKWSRASEKQNEFRLKTQNEKRLILQYQYEASELERLEAELLSRLQNTQAMERQAFMELEQAMITASLPKTQRLQIIHEMNAEHAAPSGAQGKKSSRRGTSGAVSPSTQQVNEFNPSTHQSNTSQHAIEGSSQQTVLVDMKGHIAAQHLPPIEQAKQSQIK